MLQMLLAERRDREEERARKEKKDLEDWERKEEKEREDRQKSEQRWQDLVAILSKQTCRDDGPNRGGVAIEMPSPTLVTMGETVYADVTPTYSASEDAAEAENSQHPPDSDETSWHGEWETHLNQTRPPLESDDETSEESGPRFGPAASVNRVDSSEGAEYGEQEAVTFLLGEQANEPVIDKTVKVPLRHDIADSCIQRKTETYRDGVGLLLEAEEDETADEGASVEIRQLSHASGQESGSQEALEADLDRNWLFLENLDALT